MTHESATWEATTLAQELAGTATAQAHAPVNTGWLNRMGGALRKDEPQANGISSFLGGAKDKATGFLSHLSAVIGSLFESFGEGEQTKFFGSESAAA